MKKNISNIPNLPGIYKFISNKNEILYIGKAKNLKKRIKNWIHKKKESKKEKLLVSSINQIEFTITKNENSALILESQEIKLHKPKFNVLLKDDKTYPYISIVDDSYPYLKISRKINKKNTQIGPFSNVKSVRKTISFLERNFGIRPCRYDLEKKSIKSCIYYQMQQCPAPCEKKIDKKSYQATVKSAVNFINGKKNNIFKILESQMKEASNLKNYELAAQFRDRIINLKSVVKAKRDSLGTSINSDLISLIENDSSILFSILKIRNGRVFDPLKYTVKNPISKSYENVFIEVIEQYYSQNNIPKKIIIGMHAKNIQTLKKISIFSKTKIRVPFFKWEKEKMNELYKNTLIKKNRSNKNNKKSLNELAEKINIGYPPKYIEGFDVSNIMGKNAVASQICYKNGKYESKLTRNYTIKSIKNIDDPRMIAEVISRRCKQIINNGKQPDLILVDGGITQLKATVKTLKEHFLNIPVVSLAKKFEKVYSGDTLKEVKMKKNSSAHNLLIQIRNDAHRVALRHHKKLRKKNTFI
tara:strand:- start:9677 stop:11263 length:1587 start_codon:yes stop_codon:yes gene_type:complete